MCYPTLKYINYKNIRTMKKMMTCALSAALLLTVSCGKIDVEDDVSLAVSMDFEDWKPSKTFTFSFDGTVTECARTRATLAELGITDLWLFDYVDGQVVQTVHKADGFGDVTASLCYGAHTLCFVASRGSEPTVDVHDISWEKPSDTFWAAVTMDVLPSTPTSQAVTLRRVATRLRVSVSDEITADMRRIEVEPALWYYGIDVRTGDGTDARRQVRTVDIPASYAGTRGQLTASFFGLSPSDGWQTDVDVRVTGADGAVIGSVSLPSVRFGQNMTTACSGGMLGTHGGFTLAADDGWLDENVVEW